MPGAEARLRQRIRAALRAAAEHIVVWGMPASAFTGPGRADLFGVAYGRAFNYEVKTATGRTTPVQEIVLRECRQAGSFAWVVRSPEQALRGLAWLKDHGERTPMPDEPLDIDDWFKALDEPINVVQAEPTPAVEVPSPSRIPQFNFEPLSSPFTEEHHHAVEVVTGRILPPTSDNANLDEQQDARDAQLLGVTAMPEPGPTSGPWIENQPLPVAQDGGELLVQAMTQMTDVMRKISEDLRTVGDRVTLVYEQVNRQETSIFLVNQRLDRLFALVNDEELPEVDELPAPPAIEDPTPIAPKRRRRRDSTAV